MARDTVSDILSQARLLGVRRNKTSFADSVDSARRILVEQLDGVQSPRAANRKTALAFDTTTLNETGCPPPGALSGGKTHDRVADLIVKLSKTIRQRFSDLEGLLAVPGALVGAAIPEGSKSVDLVSWRRIVLASAACVHALRQQPVPDSKGNSNGMPARAEALLTVAQWTLFLALSAPLRVAPGSSSASEAPWQTEAKHLLTSEKRTGKSSEYRAVVEVFSRGVGDDMVYLAHLRNVQAELIDAFANWQDHPVLSATPPRDLERAASLLTFAGPTRELVIPDRLEPSFGIPQTKRNDRTSRRTCANPDPEILPDLVETLFLPRFAFAVALRAVAARARGWAWSAGVLFGLAVVIGVLAVGDFADGWVTRVVATEWLPVTPWALLAAVALALSLMPAALARERLVRLVTMLRVPASVAIGTVLLATLTNHWWSVSQDTDWRQYWIACVSFVLLALGYLYFEAIGHRVGRWRALWRSITVLLWVEAMATLVVLLAFGLIFPVFVDAGEVAFLDALAELDSNGERLLLLATATTLSTVVGLFSQILWDEKAITAPLAHTSWRRKS